MPDPQIRGLIYHLIDLLQQIRHNIVIALLFNQLRQQGPIFPHDIRVHPLHNWHIPDNSRVLSPHNKHLHIIYRLRNVSRDVVPRLPYPQNQTLT